VIPDVLKLPPIVEATRAHRQEHPDEVRTVTAEEWLAETADDAGDD
jgi:hypothetical protein